MVFSLVATSKTVAKRRHAIGQAGEFATKFRCRHDVLLFFRARWVLLIVQS